MCELNVIGTPASAMWSLSATVRPWSGPLAAPATRQRVMKLPNGSSASVGRRPGSRAGKRRGGGPPPPPPPRAGHRAAVDEAAERILRVGGPSARVAVGEAEWRPPLLHAHLVEGLERGDG